MAVTLAVLGTVAGVQVGRQRSDDRRADERAAAARAGEGGGDGSDGAGGGGGSSAEDEGSGEDDGDGSLAGRILQALGGGDGGLGGAATTALLENCATALASAPVGSAGFLPERGRDTSPAEQLGEIAAQLQVLRMLSIRKVPAPVYVTPQEMSRRVRAEAASSASPEAAAQEARGLIALGALPAGADLHALALQALEEQVAGYYDPDSGELVVTGDAASGGLDGQTRIVLAHELDHALTDQVIGLPVDDGQPPADGEDAALARLALVEGDATLAMQLYGLAYVPLLDQLSGLTGALASQEQLARMPYHLQHRRRRPHRHRPRSRPRPAPSPAERGGSLPSPVASRRIRSDLGSVSGVRSLWIRARVQRVGQA